MKGHSSLCKSYGTLENRQFLILHWFWSKGSLLRWNVAANSELMAVCALFKSTRYNLDIIYEYAFIVFEKGVINVKCCIKYYI